MQREDLLALSLFVLPFVALFGACLGSFLNVCIHRIPREMSVVRPRSHCPSCQRLIPWYLNIPLLSWTLLGGRCRYCRAPIAIRYLLVEALTAVLFALVWMQVVEGLRTPALLEAWHPPTSLMTRPPVAGGWLGLIPVAAPAVAAVHMLVVFGLLLGTFVDLEHLILPNRVTIGGMILGPLLSLAVPELHGTHSLLTAFARSLLGGVVGFASLWLVATLGTLAFRKEAMGFGDVKLMGAIGAFFGWKCVLFTIIVSSFLGSIVGIALVASRRRELQGRIPYGPFIAAAAMIWMFWGPRLWNLYLRTLTPVA